MRVQKICNLYLILIFNTEMFPDIYMYLIAMQ